MISRKSFTLIVSNSRTVIQSTSRVCNSRNKASILAARQVALSRGGSRTRIGPPQGLLKEALRLYGHDLQPTVREPFDIVPEARRQVLRRTLEDLGWHKDSRK